MGMIESNDLKWLEPNIEEMTKLSEKVSQVMPEIEKNTAKEAVVEDISTFSKMKKMVRKAVNCCIE